MEEHGESELSTRPSVYGPSSVRYDVRFTKSNCTPTSCVCIIVAFIFVVFGIIVGIYFGFQFLGIGPNNERIFKGKFIVTQGDNYTKRMEDVLSNEFQKKAYFYQNILDKLYNSSSLKESYRQAEILALAKDKKGLVVHFNLHFTMKDDAPITSTDLYVILIEEVRKKKSILKGLKIDHESIHIEERISNEQTPTVWTLRRHYPGYLETPTTTETSSPDEDSRQCVSLHIDFCNTLAYNQTSYPNLVGHETVRDVTEQLVTFRQIVDFECYPFAQELVCQMLQPDCKENKLTLPCRDFCEDFMKSCKSMLRQSIIESINCTQLPKPPDRCRDQTGNEILSLNFQS